ncbi:hypothetical protein [Pontimicrobium aquaticum]|uniref:Uncharacterized protein n=1 Tax=Pontimicrobium aquaticum TaxID=2565367 RepID=A0A4U0EL98_9FLAO|nr:hypothetical protein [Pontimicrobium aquaticum]TJY32158.1 hypothetical protein E5167_14435 [Pontimicrobium aquaticum]
MINFKKVGQVAKEIEKTAEKAAGEPDTLDQIINLLDVIIWPIAMIVGLYMFKKHIGKVINSLGSIKAGAQGFEMNFIEDKLQEATKLIGIGSAGIHAKDGGGINPKDGGGINPKNGEGITPKRSHAETPYQELLVLQDSINQKLKSITSENGITTTASSNFALTSELVDRNIIKRDLSSQLKTLIELNNLALNSPKITFEQVSQMKTLFKNLSAKL